MAKIKIIKGFFGHHVNIGKKSVIRRKGPNDDAFEVDDETAKRLVDLGMAKYVAAVPVTTPPENSEEDDSSNNLPENEEPAEDENEEDAGIDIPEYSIDSHVSELRTIAKAAGITFKVGMSKGDMVDALDKHFGVMDAPALSAETPVV